MHKTWLLLIACILCSTTLLGACAGGSRGTGVRYNRSAEPSTIDDDQDEDRKNSEKDGPWRW